MTREQIAAIASPCIRAAAAQYGIPPGQVQDRHHEFRNRRRARRARAMAMRDMIRQGLPLDIVASVFNRAKKVVHDHLAELSRHERLQTTSEPGDFPG